jgi:hypothetical protein
MFIKRGHGLRKVEKHCIKLFSDDQPFQYGVISNVSETVFASILITEITSLTPSQIIDIVSASISSDRDCL